MQTIYSIGLILNHLKWSKSVAAVHDLGFISGGGHAIVVTKVIWGGRNVLPESLYIFSYVSSGAARTKILFGEAH